VPTEYGEKDRVFGVEINDRDNRFKIEGLIFRARSVGPQEGPFQNDMPFHSVMPPKQNIVKRVWKSVRSLFKRICRASCNFCWRAYRDIRYRKASAVPVVENGLIKIPLDRITDTN